MFSPEATKGVITWAYSPPRRNSVRIASPATSHSRTPSATAAVAEAVDGVGQAHASSRRAISSGSFISYRDVCIGDIAILELELGKMRR